ncbi:putative holliday junction resolvase [Acanthamoeba castellanii medusavirus]|uniref:Holliday junction resolvase n=1 Tax=Acanthamoeba castellanii medusavirus J1 TaxID=3114988 RepID=A0A3T1CWX0_9VIRU|nr:putative holliday junction resolvase [Acanthamoeba castellanii medusavirus]BBI30332.1 putative holliday junction resolvase [Acanthamoeba castellanii medusavirus J1]
MDTTIIDLTDVPWDPVSLTCPLNDGSRWATAVWVLVHWGLRQDGIVGDHMLYLFAAVCRQWRRVAHDPELRSGLMRILSFDVGTVNLAVWLGSFNPERGRRAPFVFHHWELINLETNVPTEAIQNFVRFAHTKRPYLVRNCDLVRIESQPRMEASQMQIIGACLQTYFTTAKTMVLQPKEELPRDYMALIHAGNKLKIAIDLGLLLAADRPDKPASKSGQYNWRKKVSESDCRLLLQLMEEAGAPSRWLEWFESLPKKDDVADAFLQGAHCLFHLFKHMLPPATAEDDAETGMVRPKRKRAAPVKKARVVKRKKKSSDDDEPVVKKRKKQTKKRKDAV